MVDILVRPVELRQISEQLRALSKKVGEALQFIDSDIQSLKGDMFLGNRANAVQSHYQVKRDALLKASEIVAKFAGDLDTTAIRFEKADNEKVNQLFIQNPLDKLDIDISDVMQGGLGDCYLIAAIAAVADKKPELIRNMIQDNGDGTYTVTFFEKNSFLGIFETDGFSKVEIKVSLDGSEYAKTGDQIGMSQEVWTKVIEKGYAEWAGSYKDIEGGFPHNALEAITGVDSKDFNPSSLSIDNLAESFNNGNAITANSLFDYKIELGSEKEPWTIEIPDASDSAKLYQDDVLIANHAYTVTDVNVVDGTVTVRNPWGLNLHNRDAEVVLTFEEFQENFSGVTTNSL